MKGEIRDRKRLNDAGEWVIEKEYLLDGQRVSADAFLAAFPDNEILPGQVPGGPSSSGWPMTCDALAVHPKQVAEANARNERHGISTRYLKNGRAVIPDAGDYKRLRRLEKVHFNNCFND